MLYSHSLWYIPYIWISVDYNNPIAPSHPNIIHLSFLVRIAGVEVAVQLEIVVGGRIRFIFTWKHGNIPALTSWLNPSWWRWWWCGWLGSTLAGGCSGFGSSLTGGCWSIGLWWALGAAWLITGFGWLFTVCDWSMRFNRSFGNAHPCHLFWPGQHFFAAFSHWCCGFCDITWIIFKYRRIRIVVIAAAECCFCGRPFVQAMGHKVRQIFVLVFLFQWPGNNFPCTFAVFQDEFGLVVLITKNWQVDTVIPVDGRQHLPYIHADPGEINSLWSIRQCGCIEWFDCRCVTKRRKQRVR